MYHSFLPGQKWLDTNGKPIQAHGGSVFFENGKFYFYGENKEFTTGDGKVWTYGVRMYSSDDLYNWDDEGIVFAPSDKWSDPHHPARILDRPHILHNPRTGKYVMYMKFAGTAEQPDNWGIQYMGVATADRITGPYTLQKTVRPCGMESGDFDLHMDERDGKGFLIFGRVHTEVVIADLTEDYMDVTGHYSAHFWRPGPPAGREAPAMFVRDQRYYMLTSGTTGYDPNPTEGASSRLIHGEWTEYGQVCENDTHANSFGAQYSSVFRHPLKKDLYIAIGDRWIPDESERAVGTPFLNTCASNYVWLPVQFDGERPVIRWMPEWRVEDFE